MKSYRRGKRILAVALALALMITLMTPFTKKADAGETYITFLATGGGFTCGIFVINFFNSATSMTVDTAVATRRTNTRNTFALGAFEGISIDCNALTGVGATAGLNMLSVFLYDYSSILPPQAFGFMILPATMGGGTVVPATMFRWI